VVVASGDCYIGLLGWLIARLVRAKFVFDIYDKYDEFAGYRRLLGLDLFGFLRRQADIRLYPSRALAAAYQPDAGGRPDIVVANGVDERTFHALPKAACRRQLGLDPSARMVGYFGGMERDRGVGDLVEAIELLRSRGHDIRLLVCGKQHPDTPLDRDWIIYRGMVAHDQMPVYINSADVVVVPYRTSPFMDMGASCKIAEYLMCQRPIASTRTPNFVANFPAQALELGEGLCAGCDPPDLARAIEYQLRVGQVLALPVDFSWPAIAAHALQAINDAES
jgi:glycosyltransferase involved in cell wall biosynthesis